MSYLPGEGPHKLASTHAPKASNASQPGDEYRALVIPHDERGSRLSVERGALYRMVVVSCLYFATATSDTGYSRGTAALAQVLGINIDLHPPMRPLLL